jgi:hypothetical protein
MRRAASMIAAPPRWPALQNAATDSTAPGDTPMRAAPGFCRVIVLAVGLSAGCGSSAGPSTSPAAPAAPSSGAAPASSSAGPSVRAASPTPEIGAPCDAKSVKFDAKKLDLTGPWAGDDGGIYYLRQVGKVVWWNGMSDRSARPAALGLGWNNVGRGEIKDDLTVAVQWADVPRGQILGDGTLTLKIEADGGGNIQIRKTDETGTGFGNNVWTPCSPG